MSAIQGTNLQAAVVPNDSNDVFATHLAKYGQGGLRTVQTLADRDAITAERREWLMEVNVVETNTKYTLSAGEDLLDNSLWQEVVTGVKEWQAGAQKANSLVLYAGDVYRVKQDIANGQSTPVGNTQYYQLITVTVDVTKAYVDAADQAILASINSQKATAGGLATLNSNGKVPFSQIPDSLIGQVHYKGLYDFTIDKISSGDATINNTKLPISNADRLGWYFIVTTPGTLNSLDYQVGDWLISNGADGWNKVDNTDAVMSVAGRKGNVVLTGADVGLMSTDNLVEGTTNNYFTEAKALATKLANYVKSTTTRAIATTDSILIALGILEKQSNDNTIALTNKADLVSRIVPVTQLPVATYSTPGISSVGTGLLIQSGAITVPMAAFNQRGGVKPNGNFFLNSDSNGGFIWTLPTIDDYQTTVAAAYGGVYSFAGELWRYPLSGATGSITKAAFFSAATKIGYTQLATTTAPGKVQVGTGLKVDAGIISIATFTTSTIKSAVAGGSYTNGELQGTQPAGSQPGMKFCDTTYRYEYMNGMNDNDGTTFVWIRLLKSMP